MESVLSFAERFLLDPACLWLEMSLEQRQRFQLVLFPESIELGLDEEVRTAVTSNVFKLLQPKNEDETEVVSREGLEPSTHGLKGRCSTN